ncbi:hypothetical protein AVL50_16665 [Flammeovirga sp. SJP92]|nr:hypothetical protein AVL50_16665 [Flammeovirga sp. SJP92]
MILKHNGEFYRYDWIYEFKNEIHTFSATSYQGSWANGSNGIIEYTIGSSDRIQLSGRNHESNECHDYVKNLRFNEQKKYFDTNKYSRKGSFTEITYNFFCINNMKDFYLHR